jgi:hypothetical protein
LAKVTGIKIARRREGQIWATRKGWAAIFLLWLLFAQALSAARAASITVDEGPHLATGYATLHTGDLRLQPVHIHPPLANVLAAAPLLLDPALPDPRSINGWEIASLSAVTDAVVWQYPRPARLALAGRLPIILLTLLAGALVLRWAADLAGTKAGLLALALYVLDPNVVAHGSLVTTDMAVTTFGLLTFFLLHRHQRRPSRALLAGVGLALGLALASKVSALLLPALVGVILVLRGGRRAWRRGVGNWLVIAAIAFGALWAVYGFELRALSWLAGSIPIPAATHLEIYRSLQEHYRLGHPAFLAGQNGDQGWWFYFPLAFALKTPLPALILLGMALIVFARRRPHLDAALLLFPPFYLLTSLFSSVNIGYRHLLPISPFLYIFVASQFGSREYGVESTHHASARSFTFYVLRFTLYALFLWLALGAALVYPFPLAFFNELAGGPGGGYHWLVDSNLDWGQNLWQLHDWMRSEGVERVYYSHFSPARPKMYGVNADWLPPDPRAVPFAPFDPAPGVYAIGATTLQGVYTPGVNTFAWFRSHEPIAWLGHVLFIYEVPPREPPVWAAVCTNPAPVLSPETVRANFDRPDMRVMLIDCDQSWVYPAADDESTAYIWPPDAEPPLNASLEMTARHPDGSALYTLYRVRGMEPSPLSAFATIQGPLTYTGYQLNARTAHTGEALELLWTWWQVKERPDRPLSLMAHVIGPDGTPIAVADGLGMPIEQWQPGDIFVQRHRFAIPQDTPPGEYQLQIGVYWLDTLERWPVHRKDGSTNDRLLLDKITILD